MTQLLSSMGTLHTVNVAWPAWGGCVAMVAQFHGSVCKTQFFYCKCDPIFTGLSRMAPCLYRAT